MHESWVVGYPILSYNERTDPQLCQSNQDLHMIVLWRLTFKHMDRRQTRFEEAMAIVHDRATWRGPAAASSSFS